MTTNLRLLSSALATALGVAVSSTALANTGLVLVAPKPQAVVYHATDLTLPVNNSHTTSMVLAKEQSYTGFLDYQLLSLDPAFVTDINAQAVLRPLYDTLTRQDAEGNYIPLAAQEITSDAAGLVWTFKLDSTARWTDGRQVTAQDFVQAWQRLADPATQSPNRFYLTEVQVANAQAVAQGKLPVTELGITALDQFTLQVTLDHANPYFLQQVSNVRLAPVRVDLIKQHGEAWTDPSNLVTNGPFVLSKITPFNYQLSKRTTYRGASQIYLNKVVFEVKRELTDNYYSYLQQKSPLATIPYQFLDRALEERRDEMHRHATPEVFFYRINGKNLANVQVRKAISLLIDRNAVTTRVLGAHRPTTRMTDSHVNQSAALEQQDFFDKTYRENIEEAVRLLTQAGYTPSKPLELHLLAAATPEDRKVNEAILSMLRNNSGKLIKITRTELDYPSYQAAVQNGEFDLALGSLLASYNHVRAYLEHFRCDNPTNDSTFCNLDYDELLNKAVNNPDAQQSDFFYNKANQLLVGSYGVLPLWEGEYTILVSPALGGYNANTADNYLRDFYLLRDKQIKIYK